MVLENWDENVNISRAGGNDQSMYIRYAPRISPWGALTLRLYIIYI
jgi:hypothetical protein